MTEVEGQRGGLLSECEEREGQCDGLRLLAGSEAGLLQRLRMRM